MEFTLPDNCDDQSRVLSKWKQQNSKVENAHVCHKPTFDLGGLPFFAVLFLFLKYLQLCILACSVYAHCVINIC